ncbi:MAG TPA: alpha-L-rhamnosidase C-terminal domain-containing protein, partial [Candidatus Hydrogenedentes bacterium]|nr:alpha-L-rhamnosidase C-terminal domain-containing protein [Candidatus Hydrogenedentota bacterium]
HYIKEIERFDGHLATGFIGTPRLLPTLSLAGRDDVGYRLLMNTTYPSWLFQVTLGATTMWERWNGWTPDKGFADSGMNSFNHYAFGAVGEWLYSRVAGIRPDAPGFEKIYIEPVPGGGLTYARMNYQSIRGLIISSWRVEGDSFLLDVEIPANTTATVCIPTRDAASITEGGKPLEEAGISVETILDGSILCRLGSGTYQFQALARK